jgi:hypothetical protein
MTTATIVSLLEEEPGFHLEIVSRKSFEEATLEANHILEKGYRNTKQIIFTEQDWNIIIFFLKNSYPPRKINEGDPRNKPGNRLEPFSSSSLQSLVDHLNTHLALGYRDVLGDVLWDGTARMWRAVLLFHRAP